LCLQWRFHIGFDSNRKITIENDARIAKAERRRERMRMVVRSVETRGEEAR
jgi:hypothetical protein